MITPLDKAKKLALKTDDDAKLSGMNPKLP